MKPRCVPVLSTITATLALSASTAFAGQLHPALEDALAAKSATEMTSVIVYMADQADIAAIDRSLTLSSAKRAERHQTVVGALQSAATAQEPLAAELDLMAISGAIEGYTRYWIVSAIVVKGTTDAIRRIADRDDVSFVDPNFTVSLIEPVGGFTPSGEDGAGLRGGSGSTPGLRAMNVPRVWNELGITGEGVIVANCDTGVDGTHPALADRWRGANGASAAESWLNVLGSGSTTFPWDSGSHGSHVMGTITGLSAAGDSIGVAYGAQWIASNAIGQGGGSELDNDIIDSYQWFADPDGDPGTSDDVPDVVQNSWRVNESFSGYSDCDGRWNAAIDNASAAGVISIWSAGNEGPGSETIGSPADRIATPLTSFSIGAVDATNFGYPYPIASFSSRGPSGCDGSTIKPEVCAPGVDVWSSVPGGYGFLSGTSMSGPHVTGLAALIRSANPDLTVDAVKQLIHDTAIDFGPAGEDNGYGNGFVDAYEAVSQALEGIGSIEGTVTHADTGTPVPGAVVEIVEAARTIDTDADGHYASYLTAGTYTVRVTHPAFLDGLATDVAVVESAATVQDFALDPNPLDSTPPTITDVAQPCATDGVLGPYWVSATITDDLVFVETELLYSVDGGEFLAAGASVEGDVHSFAIPGQPLGTEIDFYISASDANGNVATDPVGAPAVTRRITVSSAVTVFTDDVESDTGWILGDPGDTATTGVWERGDPQGTTSGGDQVQPEDDHTPLGTDCFVTGLFGSGAGDNDVDDGCTTLTSPVFDMSGAADARVSYWRWWYNRGSVPDDDVFEADISNDGGATWMPLERLTSTVGAWTEARINVCQILPLTSDMRLRFHVCDDPNNSLTESAIDDVLIETFDGEIVGVDDATTILGPPTGLTAVSPNPFNPHTSIEYALSTPSEVSLEVFAANGRLVATLVQGRQAAGRYAFSWEGTAGDGTALSSGVYFVRLSTESGEFRERVTLLK